MLRKACKVLCIFTGQDMSDPEVKSHHIEVSKMIALLNWVCDSCHTPNSVHYNDCAICGLER